MITRLKQSVVFKIQLITKGIVPLTWSYRNKQQIIMLLPNAKKSLLPVNGIFHKNSILIFSMIHNKQKVRNS